jgi:hypothetical protein
MHGRDLPPIEISYCRQERKNLPLPAGFEEN